MRDDLIKLQQALARIEAILGKYGEVTKLRALPANRAEAINAVRIRDAEYRPDGTATGRVVEAARQLARREREDAQVECDRGLRDLSHEIEALRAALPSLAAAAAIELGVIARELRGGANG